MAGDYIPKSDTGFQAWLGNFLTIASANLSSIGLISGDITPLQTDKTNLDAALIDLENKHAAAKAATATKESLRKSAETKARLLVKRIQAKVDVTNTIKAQLQITVPGTAQPPPIIPLPPVDLVANIIGAGEYELTWKRGGNTSSTPFAIQAKIGTATDWSIIFVTTKTVYKHLGNPPGVKITYRVLGQHGEILGPPSNEAVVNNSTPPPPAP